MINLLYYYFGGDTHAPRMSPPRGGARCVKRHAKVSGYRRLGLAGDKQRVARRPIKTDPMSTVRCVPCPLQVAVGTHCRGPLSGQLSAGPGSSAGVVSLRMTHTRVTARLLFISRFGTFVQNRTNVSTLKFIATHTDKKLRS